MHISPNNYVYITYIMVKIKHFELNWVEQLSAVCSNVIVVDFSTSEIAMHSACSPSSD